jgi:hypothetical protein
VHEQAQHACCRAPDLHLLQPGRAGQGRAGQGRAGQNITGQEENRSRCRSQEVMQQQPRGCRDQAFTASVCLYADTLELPVVLSMTRLKAFSMPKGVNFSFTCMHTPPASCLTQHKQSINQSINVLNVLGGNWEPTDKKFSSVNSYRQAQLVALSWAHCCAVGGCPQACY